MRDNSCYEFLDLTQATISEELKIANQFLFEHFWHIHQVTPYISIKSILTKSLNAYIDLLNCCDFDNFKLKEYNEDLWADSEVIGLSQLKLFEAPSYLVIQAISDRNIGNDEPFFLPDNAVSLAPLVLHLKNEENKPIDLYFIKPSCNINLYTSNDFKKSKFFYKNTEYQRYKLLRLMDFSPLNLESACFVNLKSTCYFALSDTFTIELSAKQFATLIYSAKLYTAYNF